MAWGAATRPQGPAVALPQVCGCWRQAPGTSWPFFPAWELASRLLAKPIQTSFAAIGKPTQEPAGPCAPLRPGRWVYEKEGKRTLWAGRRVYSAPVHGSLHRQLWSHFILRRLRVVPYGLPGYRRLRRAPPQHRCSPSKSREGLRGIWEDSVQAQGNTPYAPRGGRCGCLAARHTFSKPAGGTCRLGTPQG